MNSTLKTGQSIKIDGEIYTIKGFADNKDIIIVTKYSFDNPIYKVKQNEMGNFIFCNDYNAKNIQWKLRK